MLKMILFFLIYTTVAFSDDYPEIWWEPVSRAEAPEWEVLPQDAKPGEVILSKRNELGLLSNFSETPFKLDGVIYPSVEGFWQMMKYPETPTDERNRSDIEWPYTRSAVAKMIGFEAKEAGDIASENMKALGINWVTYHKQKLLYRENTKGEHYKLIRRAMWAKLKQNPEVKKVLLLTGNLQLKPDHLQGKNTPPAWQYHIIWMQIREQLQKSNDFKIQ